MFAARSILVLGAALFGGSYLAAAAGACDRLSLQFASHPKVS
jgi:NAD-dependent oxidoreductase involved in siderophore biosynthesis